MRWWPCYDLIALGRAMIDSELYTHDPYSPIHSVLQALAVMN